MAIHRMYSRHPLDPDDVYCFYCSKQYKSLAGFKRHIVQIHGVGLAARLGILTDEEEQERQRVMRENGEADDPKDMAMVRRQQDRIAKRRGITP